MKKLLAIILVCLFACSKSANSPDKFCWECTDLNGTSVDLGCQYTEAEAREKYPDYSYTVLGTVVQVQKFDRDCRKR